MHVFMVEIVCTVLCNIFENHIEFVVFSYDVFIILFACPLYRQD